MLRLLLLVCFCIPIKANATPAAKKETNRRSPPATHQTKTKKKVLSRKTKASKQPSKDSSPQAGAKKGGSSQPPSHKHDPNRREYSILPSINYSTDRGFGFGILGSIAQFQEGIAPYHWRLFFRIFATVKLDDDGVAEFPYHRDVLVFDLRGLAHNKARLLLRAGFFRFSTTGYFGLGNAAIRDPKRPRRYYQYERTYPTASAGLFLELWRRGHRKLELYSSLSFMYNTIAIGPNSKLKEDLKRSRRGANDTDLKLQEILRGLRPHTQIKAVLGLLYDSRNHEFSPSQGMFHELSVRAVLPGLAPGMTFAAGHLNLRFFVPIWRSYLVLAVRFMADAIWGNPPLYELYTLGGIDNLEGPGGLDTLRGIKAQRYYGKIKLIGNIELRSVFFDFILWRQHIRLGLLLFADAGRVWLDYNYTNDTTRTAFDGNEHGITLALGGGGRLQWGETFVLRVDVGYSPTDKDFGFYFWVNHMF